MLYPIVLKAREDTKLRIKEACKNVYSNKLDAYNIIENKKKSEKTKI